MSNKMKDLFNKEEMVILNLKNMNYQAKQYLKEIDRLESKYDLSDFVDESKWFRSVFTYYLEELIPALEESSDLEAKHIQVIKNNPDELLHIMEEEVSFHQHLMQCFIARFKTIHEEFHKLCISIKTQ